MSCLKRSSASRMLSLRQRCRTTSTQPLTGSNPYSNSSTRFVASPHCSSCGTDVIAPQNLARAQRDQEKDELDEEALVKNVRPLIEQAHGILQEALGGIKALDPGGKVSQQSSRRAADHQATPEEHHLAESLGTVRCSSKAPVSFCYLCLQYYRAYSSPET